MQVWSGHAEAALPVIRDLAAHYPADPGYGVALVRVQMALHRHSQAAKTLAGVLSTYPHGPDARWQVACQELHQGHSATALCRFNCRVAENPPARKP